MRYSLVVKLSPNNYHEKTCGFLQVMKDNYLLNQNKTFSIMMNKCTEGVPQTVLQTLNI